MINNYIVSPVTLFDEDEQLWFTKVGLDAPEMPLLYTVWGKTKADSLKEADFIKRLLEHNDKMQELFLD